VVGIGIGIRHRRLLRRPSAILMAMSSPAERAAHRRATWSGGVVRSFAEAEERDLEFWLAATPQERLRGVTQLIHEMAMMEGARGPSPRLQRSVGGTRPRRG
jgi:hypothetical protein